MPVDACEEELGLISGEPEVNALRVNPSINPTNSFNIY